MRSDYHTQTRQIASRQAAQKHVRAKVVEAPVLDPLLVVVAVISVMAAAWVSVQTF